MNMKKYSGWLIPAFLTKLLIMSVILSVPVVQAVDLDTSISSEDKAKFDEMLSPLTKFYNLVKYGASVVAALVLVIAGVMFMLSGNDIRKRENSKHTAGYVLVGLGLIWAAPFVVDYLTA